MANTAYQIQYRQEYISAFEAGEALLRMACTTETMIQGNQATFLVAGSGDATAVTRGSDGRIPARYDDLNQYTATLTEWHDVVEKTRFNIFAGQSNQQKIMQEQGVKVMNRKIEDEIITELNNATLDANSTASKASVDLVTTAVAILGQNNVPTEEEDKMFGLISPAFYKYMIQAPEFSSRDYVEVGAFNSNGTRKKVLRWFGINWIKSTRITGLGTNAEKCYIFHKDAIGHALDKKGLTVALGHDERHDFSWARTSAFMGSKILQNSGIIRINHDASAIAAS